MAAVSLDPGTTHLDASEEAASPLVLVVAAQGRLSTHSLPITGRTDLGRAKEAAIAIDHPHVSRLHANVWTAAGGPAALIEDLGSANGTWVRDRRLQPGERVPLEPGDIVRLGRSVCCWLDTGAAGQDHTPPELALEGEEPRVVASEAMRALHAAIDRIADGEINVLICGETGVGKGIVARAIHARSRRARGPFLTLDCAGLSESLLEGELFGHEKGADGGRPGLLECARGGTIFLDEVGELPAACQAKLLRPLEERTVLRLGAIQPVPIDVRFLAATNRDLEAEVAAGRFRRDLFFRLNGFSLVVPPLSARPGEVRPLAEAWARFFAGKLSRPAPELSPGALALLERHTWPGNVRELRSAIERAVLLAGAGPIQPDHLHLMPAGPAPRAVRADEVAGDDELTRPFRPVEEDEPPGERERIARALDACAGNQSRAAKQLGISRSTLIRKIDRYGLPRPRGPRSDSED